MISFKLINLAAVLTQHFHSASALLTVQTAVRLSVRPSVIFRYCVQTNEDTIVWVSASGRTILLVSEEVKVYLDIPTGSPLARALK